MWGTTGGVCDAKAVGRVVWIVGGFEFEVIGSWSPLFVAADVVVLSVVLCCEELVEGAVDMVIAGWVVKRDNEVVEGVGEFLVIVTDVCAVRELEDVTEWVVPAEGVDLGVTGIDEGIGETDFDVSKTLVFVGDVVVWNVDELLSNIVGFAEELVRSLEDMADGAFVIMGWVVKSVDKDGNTGCRLVPVATVLKTFWVEMSLLLIWLAWMEM